MVYGSSSCIMGSSDYVSSCRMLFLLAWQIFSEIVSCISTALNILLSNLLGSG